MNKEKTFFDVKASVDGKSADVFILGEITTWAWEEYGEMSSVIFKEKLDAVGDVSTIHLYVNSPGGSVFEGIAIANMLKRHKARVIGHVEALAASIASNIIASCDEVRMPSNSMLMIHNALNGVFGNAKELRKAADDLDRINEVQIETYMAKVGNKATEEQIRALMDEETWISAKEAYELGLCDVVEGANQAVASLTSEQLKQFKNVPKALIVEDKQQNILSEEERNTILADSKANLTYLKSLNLI
ncbi:Clp protease ClpP [Lysinibacillus sphaericus]|uniref:head maturation protease, ClpP-related n=1 Tax=Lysinibacillus sphaericus TaxID=1421 RepID=UPI0018CEEF42|nr:head maturation protease, ClpP-related [Lysinibacillus sphaericus]MBG9453306.1 Clp protease ClpP [Lysinibacillus sphaericus]MBG9477090.1 Clp protease ClpP [Lysinibacillus sphaericus]MBG9591172.1 Clp protease ClpP [Lysinibacillus sphaericus]MBG9592010.1 Clp protease ClpP [Lysinibacillus sphaericus]